MRLVPIPPDTMSPDIRAMHDEIEQAMGQHLTGFVAQRSDGSNIPFAPMLHYPVFGQPLWNLIRSLMNNSTLPRSAHEVAILVTAARYNSRFELYSHEVVAVQAGLSSSQIAAITSGQLPGDLDPQARVAYEITHTLVNGNQLSDTAYQHAIDTLGHEQTVELFYLAGTYCLISVVLNAFDVPVPGSDSEAATDDRDRPEIDDIQ